MSRTATEQTRERRRSPLECVQDAIALQAWHADGGGSNVAMVGPGTVDGLLDLILTATPEELAAIRQEIQQ